MCGRLSTQVAISTDVFELGGRFDTIFALDVLEHIPDLEKVSVKLKELIGDFGQLIISGPTENTFYHLGRRLAGFRAITMSEIFMISNASLVKSDFEKLN